MFSTILGCETVVVRLIITTVDHLMFQIVAKAPRMVYTMAMQVLTVIVSSLNVIVRVVVASSEVAVMTIVSVHHLVVNRALLE